MTSLLLGCIRAYQRWWAPCWPPACRYVPSCSHYASEAIVTHGVMKGLMYTAQRLLRCHPWARSGIDPVPSARSA